MKGLEMMLANLLGMKPDEMRSKVETAVNLMEQGAKTAATIQHDLALIKSHLGIEEKEFEHGGRAIANSRNSANSHHIEL
jgi:hypothetical protein